MGRAPAIDRIARGTIGQTAKLPIVCTSGSRNAQPLCSKASQGWLGGVDGDVLRR